MQNKEIKFNYEDEKNLWNDFATKYDLSEDQLDKFKVYADLLISWNEKINLTSIVKIDEIIKYHFEDSLSIIPFIDFSNIHSICDIGTGGGFPGIPLKIKYSYLNIVLIEVSLKKIEFIQSLIDKLELHNIEICSLDWRTFLRKTDYSIDLFLSRASLHTDELMRMFKPSSPYNNKELVYWASTNWKIDEPEKNHFKKEETYSVGDKKRKLIFFSK